MVEFSEKLDKRYEGVQALARRTEYRAFSEKYVIPYTLYGIDYALFQNNGEFLRSAQEVFNDLDIQVRVEGGRMMVADLTIDPKTMEVV